MNNLSKACFCVLYANIEAARFVIIYSLQQWVKHRLFDDAILITDVIQRLMNVIFIGS
jgi:hypothetical protein